jgi:hypothetical protein
VVLDRVAPGSISIRKLVLEVGYFNVLTAYSVEEARPVTWAVAPAVSWEECLRG